jgi:hypothetical protein
LLHRAIRHVCGLIDDLASQHYGVELVAALLARVGRHGLIMAYAYSTSTELVMPAGENENPYAPPTASMEATDPACTSLPRFVKVVFVLDLLVSLYRVLNSSLALVALVWFRELAFGEESAGRAIPYVIAEIPIGILVGISGAVADVLGLKHRYIAFKIGVIANAGSVAFLAVLIAKFATWLPEIPSKTIGISMLAALAVVRLALIWVYFVALQRFRRWRQSRENQNSK